MVLSTGRQFVRHTGFLQHRDHPDCGDVSAFSMQGSTADGEHHPLHHAPSPPHSPQGRYHPVPVADPPVAEPFGGPRALGGRISVLVGHNVRSRNAAVQLRPERRKISVSKPLPSRDRVVFGTHTEGTNHPTMDGHIA